MPPPAVKRNHIKWNEKYRMIARARDKGYEQGARVTVVNFYLNDRFMQRDQPCGFRYPLQQSRAAAAPPGRGRDLTRGGPRRIRSSRTFARKWLI